MTKTIKRLLPAALAVLLAGCAADTAPQNADLPVITVGCDNYPPFNYVNGNGQPAGIDVELAAEAFRRMGYRPEYITIIHKCQSFNKRISYKMVEKFSKLS